MSERALASIQRIHTIKPIEGADNIELALVNGWQCVVKKGQFQLNDLAIYIEIDSILPLNPAFSFLKPNHRVRTIKLRKELSQGLLMPIMDLLGWATHVNITADKEGMDVTEELGITKYEPPEHGVKGCSRVGSFPSHLPKTDESRVQNVHRNLREMQGKPYFITLKYDGSSATYCMLNSGFTICSRNLQLQWEDPEMRAQNKYAQIADRYKIEQIITENPEISIQGEIVGPGIQSNHLALTEIDFFVFTVMWNGIRVSIDQQIEFCNKHGLKHVEVLEHGNAFAYDQPALLAKAEGKYPGTSNEREGIVIRSTDQKMSFKAISNRFLLKEKDEPVEA